MTLRRPDVKGRGNSLSLGGRVRGLEALVNALPGSTQHAEPAAQRQAAWE